MNRTGTTAGHRARTIRTTALAVVGVTVLSGLTWSAASMSSASTGAASAVAVTPAVGLADAVVRTGDEPRPAAGRGPAEPRSELPAELRSDLRALRGMEPGRRAQAAARIRREALDGDYGTLVRLRAEQAQRRRQALPPQLREDLARLRGLPGEQWHARLLTIRDKALDGGYGDRARRWAERHRRFWQQP
ncbi:hypothetical protein ACH4ZX_03285 [Streptomyces sp. NPDC020490]|uniref:hypothetical protein n=1 Tax=Streptomyces sp. NPDC020490 TaxID=3365078 RepID=UPI0037AF924A